FYFSPSGTSMKIMPVEPAPRGVGPLAGSALSLPVGRFALLSLIAGNGAGAGTLNLLSIASRTLVSATLSVATGREGLSLSMLSTGSACSEPASFSGNWGTAQLPFAPSQDGSNAGSVLARNCKPSVR